MSLASSNPMGMTQVAIPSPDLLQIVYPSDDWFVEGRDPKAHERQLRLDRGFYLFKKWWKERNIKISQLVEEHSEYCLYGIPELEELVREMHQRIAPRQKNAGCHLVFGLGAMNLLNASLYATSMYHNVRKNPLHLDPLPLHEGEMPPSWVNIDRLYVTQQLPAYLELKKSLHTGLGLFASWVDFPLHDTVPQENLVEYVTSLNNPNGVEREAATQAHYIINDRVNHMPMFYTDEPARYAQITLENDWISIFSLSKFLGFSGSRVGYAFVRDAEIAHYMKYYITLNTHGLAIEGHLRCIAALRYLMQHSFLESFIQWYVSELQKRWQQLRQVLHDPKMELLNTQAGNAWIHIHGENAEKYLRDKYNILATYGTEYGVSAEFVRVNLLGKQNEFDELLYRLKTL